VTAVARAPFCVAVHAERLEDRRVWDLVRRALDAHPSLRATWFVSPVHAIWSDVDLGDRLSELTDRSQEIGQHTHFYDAARSTIEPGNGEALMTEVNITACLDRDHSYLVERGHAPRGFVSGAWALDPVIDAWLRRERFLYDCSWRTYVLPYQSHGSDRGDGRAAAAMDLGVLRLPTTTSLRRSLPRRRTAASPIGPYELVYLHDYDLLDAGKRLMLRALCAARAGAPRCTLGAVADAVTSAGSISHE